MLSLSGMSMDQADTLRTMAIGMLHDLTDIRPPAPASAPASAPAPAPAPARSTLPRPVPRIIAVTSGKGGVGKSTVTINLAVAFANVGKKVLVIDADLGLGNIDVQLGLNPPHTLNDVFSGAKTLGDIIMNGPAGIKLVPAGSGVQRYTDLESGDRLRLMDELELLDEEFDIILIDTESGISRNVTYFNVAAQEILLVVAPEPSSITDSYALIKLLSKYHAEEHFKVLVNMARDDNEGMLVFKKLSQVVGKFLDVSLDYLGCIVRDERQSDASRRQRPVVQLYPRSSVAYGFSLLARHILEDPPQFRLKGNIQFLFSKFFEPSQAVRCV